MLTDFALGKVRAVDLTLAEFEEALGSGEIIQERVLLSQALKELVLLLEWTLPLHIVGIVDERRREERIPTVFEPDPAGSVETRYSKQTMMR